MRLLSYVLWLPRASIAQQIATPVKEPNVVSYSAMIDTCAKAGDLQRAELWYALESD